MDSRQHFNQIMSRFGEAHALNDAIHCFNFRVNTTDPTVAAVSKIAVGIMQAQLEDILNLGIKEYQTWKEQNDNTSSR